MNEYNVSAPIKAVQGILTEDNKHEATGRLLFDSVAQHNLALVDAEGKMITNPI